MFDDTNGYGAIPDALPAGYGYADAQPTTVRQNMETAVSTNPFAAGNRTQSMNEARPEVRPSLADAMPSGPIQARVVSASRSQAASTNMVHQTRPRPTAYGNAAPSPTQVPIKVTKSGRRYREFRGSGGYIYAQFEDGSYAILLDGYDVATKKRGGYPKGVKQGVPFTAANNEKAFLSVRNEVESAIGPFPMASGVTTAVAPAGGGGGGTNFVPSTADTAPRPPPPERSWFAKSTGGIPNWGWVAGAAVVTASAGYLIYKNAQTPAAPASPKPTNAPQPPAPKQEGQGS